MKTPGDISIDIADGIATVRLASPARRNAMSTAMWHKLAAFAADVPTRKDVRVVIIRGDGEQMFSAGADISDFATARSGEGQARAYDDLVENTCQAIEAIPMTQAKTSAWRSVKSPVTSGRFCVRFMIRSISRSM